MWTFFHAVRQIRPRYWDCDVAENLSVCSPALPALVCLGVHDDLLDRFHFCPSPHQAVSDNASEALILDLSNRFYTLIPHDFGMKKPPLLSNLDYIQVRRGQRGSL